MHQIWFMMLQLVCKAVSKDSISVTIFSIVGNSLLKSEPDAVLFR